MGTIYQKINKKPTSLIGRDELKFDCCQGVMEEMEREKEESRGERLDAEEKTAQRNLFMKDGRPYNINDAKLGFSVKDERCVFAIFLW